MTKRKIFKGFTLAEVLTTLMVIGVVAVLTVPALMQQINGITIKRQKDVFSKKWAEGLRRMRVDGKLEGPYTTESFTNEMKKYFAISTICNSDNLPNCFTEKFTSMESGEGEEFEVKDLKNAKNFNDSIKDDSPVYGIKFVDGTSMLISYKNDCNGLSEGNTTGNHSACLYYVFDANGSKSPNKFGGNTGADAKKDDKALTAKQIEEINNGRDLVGNVSITKANPFKDLSFSIVAINPERISFGAAKEFCASKGASLPSKENIAEIIKAIIGDAEYVETTFENEYNIGTSDFNLDFSSNTLALALGLGTEPIDYWLINEDYHSCGTTTNSAWCRPMDVDYWPGSGALCVK